jgi:hypothetical protein
VLSHETIFYFLLAVNLTKNSNSKVTIAGSNRNLQLQLLLRIVRVHGRTLSSLERRAGLAS